MERFDKINLRALRPELERALSDVCAKHGITATIGSGSFTDLECKFKLILNLEGSGEVKSTAKQADFERYAALYGLEPTDLGKTFIVGGNSYTITGLSPNRPKFPIDGIRYDGRQFKFPVLTVKIALGKNRVTTM
ncbi:MAG: hypothetical protein EKK63_13810 [Acinetobacter sp.]|uniref:hypothetical protein n=1 Tax=Acinetobacter sp. TaxID=472 RepID=UPI000FC1634B|nr:hypothetical protein [Acinetobacter sp.]RUP37977.1 MAG: hypothetical protein EKK63_13810 [Acinetobacter sp.]